MNYNFLIELKKMQMNGSWYDKDNNINRNFLKNSENLRELYIEERDKYFQYIDELAILIKKVDPIQILAYFSFEREKCYLLGKTDECIEIFQQELLQALVLSSDNDKKYIDLDINTINKIKDHLLIISYLSLIELDDGEDISLKLKLKKDTAYLRINTIPLFEIDINRKLFSNIDKSTKYEMDIHISKIIDMFCNIIKDIKGKFNDYLRWITYNNINNIDLLYIREIITYSVDDFVKAYGEGVSKGSIIKILDKVSNNLNEKLEIDVKNIIINNPIWKRFLIKCDNERYIFPMVELFLSRIREISEYLIAEHPASLKKYNIKKGPFLEEEVEKLFKSKFKDSEIFTNSFWENSEDGKIYENDILITFKNYAIIIEAKGNGISFETREGNVYNAEKDIKKIILKASEQANGFKKFLIKNKGELIILNKKNKDKNYISLRGIDKYICISVSIDGMDGLGNSQLQWFEKFKGNKKELIIPNIQLAHLKVIFDILETDIEIIHYFIQRTKLDRTLKYVADELDLLGIYIESGLNIDLSIGENIAPFSGLSHKIDNYYYTKKEKPACARTQLFSNGIEKLRRLSKNSIDEVLLMFNINFRGQNAIEEIIKKYLEELKGEFNIPPKNILGVTNKSEAIISYLYSYYYEDKYVKECIEKDNYIKMLLEKYFDKIYVLGVQVDVYGNYSCEFIISLDKH